MSLVQMVYTVHFLVSIKRKKIFDSLASTIQTCIIELAVFVFLGILTYFAFNQNDEFYQTTTSKNMQLAIFIAVIIAVSAQAISVIWGVY